MSNVIPFKRKLECVSCGRQYTAAVRPTDHPLLKERRAHICPACLGSNGGEIAVLSHAIDDFLAPIKDEVSRTGDPAAYLSFLIELQRLGVPDA